MAEEGDVGDPDSCATAERLTLRSEPPASPSVTMQYDTSRPSDVQRAVLPAQPKSQSSGWATTIRMRRAESSSATAVDGSGAPRCHGRSLGRS
jgi:hypothetical protein